MFHPVVRAWFEQCFPHGATTAQRAGWKAIAAGQHTLIAAPTGSGKTLAGFLVCIDQLFRQPERARGIQVVYISPLRALAVDIQHNLERPLAEMRELAASRGEILPEVRVGIRTSDSTASQRMAISKHPPDILVTTPESLYLLLTATRSRQALTSVQTVIIDEIHALARDKRGAHLSLSLERLAHLCAKPPLRIGLSATQRPMADIAQFLVGVSHKPEPEGPSRTGTIVDTGHRRDLDLALSLPELELEAVASNEHMLQVLDGIARHAAQRRTTLVFVNTRRLSERVAHLLSERLGTDQVSAHHGSLSKDRRQRIEARLRSGDLRVVVATASLELGIDIGPVELVCQIGSPRSIATFLQRVGRSGHARYATPVGKLYPLTRDELVECAALLAALKRGELDAICIPTAPLDILAQQIVAECAAQTWHEDALFELLRSAYPYRALTRAQYEEVLTLVSEGVVTGRGRRADYLQRDRVERTLQARRGARLSALTSGGAIPENADYRVVAEPDDVFVGTVNEDFAIESMIGDVFLLGSTAWRIRRVQPGVVRVVDAQGATPTVPFWLGEAPGRSLELSRAVSELRHQVELQLASGGVEQACATLVRDTGLSNSVVSEIVSYLAATRDALGLIPTQTHLVFERFFDETGGMQLVLHAPFGARINRALGLLLRKRFCTSFDFELQAAASDDAVVLSLGPQHSLPLSELPAFLRRSRVQDALTHAVIVTPMFTARWRWNLNRALIVLRMKRGKKNPPALQRMESDDVMVAVFPALAACQDNAQGPREIPDHVLVRQTLHDCMHEAMDLPGLDALLTDIETGAVQLHFRETTEPSVLAHEILSARPYTFLDDAPLEERRTHAVPLSRGLPRETRDLVALDPDAIAQVQRELAIAPRSAAELYDVLVRYVVLPADPSHAALFAELVEQGRAFAVHAGDAVLWVALERMREAFLLYPEAVRVPELPLPQVLADEPAPELESVLDALVRGHLERSGPCTLAQLAARTQLAAQPLSAALLRVEFAGFLLRGRWAMTSQQTTSVANVQEGEPPEAYCARPVLNRIHAYTRKRLRRAIEPVTRQQFMLFLLRHHGVVPGSQRVGVHGTAQVIAQLQGFEVAAAQWESQVLAARVNGYRREWLDQLCLSGQVSWGRATHGSVQNLSEPRALQPTRATPITLALREDFSWLIAAARGTRSSELAPLSEAASQVRAQLEASGALFFSQLCARTGLRDDVVREALWEGVARGLISADGFEPLRNLLAPAIASSSAFAVVRRSGLRLGASASPPRGEGRWSLLSGPLSDVPIDELAEAVIEQWIARWGVVFYELCAYESCALPWRELVQALRRLEARGVLRSGRFVTGFSGEQFAAPETVEHLRVIRSQPLTGQRVVLSACDPLNLTGILFDGPRIPKVGSQTVTFRDGIPQLDNEAEAAPPAG